MKFLKRNYQVFITIDVCENNPGYCIVADLVFTKIQFGIVTNNEEGIKQLIVLV